MTEGPSKGTVMLGIYEFDGDTLKVCFDAEGKKRPTEFKSAPGSAIFVILTSASKSKWPHTAAGQRKRGSGDSTAMSRKDRSTPISVNRYVLTQTESFREFR